MLQRIYEISNKYAIQYTDIVVQFIYNTMRYPPQDTDTKLNVILAL